MSESAGSAGATSAGATSGADVTQAASSNETSGQESSQQKTASEQAGVKSTEKNPGKAASKDSQDDGFEDVKIGSVQGRVPKEIAQALKNLERGFNSKAQEAAQTKKLLSLAQDNPKEFYKQTGKDAYEFAEALLAEKYEEMMMDPKDKELRDLRKLKEDKDNADKSSKQEVLEALKEFGPLPKGAENASREELIEYYGRQKETYQKEWSSLDSQIGDAFKDAKLPADKHLLAKVAFEMSSALKRGKSLSAKDAVAKVNGEYYSGVKQTLGNMDVKRIHEMLGDEFLDKLRQYDLDGVTAKSASRFGQNNNGPAQAASDQPKKSLNQSEWRKAMGLT